ncbi:hypothetical protein BS78_08G074500 [Paspalum vaginatum]|nr:hypothetical protein BS78_08G074500 [Paspalum vaginatum]
MARLCAHRPMLLQSSSHHRVSTTTASSRSPNPLSSHPSLSALGPPHQAPRREPPLPPLPLTSRSPYPVAPRSGTHRTPGSMQTKLVSRRIPICNLFYALCFLYKGDINSFHIQTT